jgi:hypothetical protein
VIGRILASAILTSLTLAAPAYAAKPIQLPPAPVACAITDVSPSATACSGFYDGNLLGGSADKKTAASAALLSLGLVTDGTWLEAFDFGQGSNKVDFAAKLNGVTYIGIHFGAGNDGPVHGHQGGGTAFYKITFAPDADLDFFFTGFPGGANSSARLYATAAPTSVVPEPATWAMMIVGFGLAGSAVRVTRRKSASFA